ncbi:hypothetical protein X741_11250 [Mesorhizobium sp. LNHC229A00]|nr:hypothetical protein X741_11250 [Mesorhizobium sp. LNHC229A00]
MAGNEKAPVVNAYLYMASPNGKPFMNFSNELKDVAHPLMNPTLYFMKALLEEVGRCRRLHFFPHQDG